MRFDRFPLAAIVLCVAALSGLPGNARAQGGGIGTTNFGNLNIDFAEAGSNRFWAYEQTQDWWTLRTLPGTIGVGGDIASRFNGCTYGLIGNGTPIFYRAGPACGPSSGNVERLADAPFIPGRGAKLSSLNGATAFEFWDYVYALRGGDTAELWRYSIAANSWTRLPDVPEPVDDAGALDLVFAAYSPAVLASMQLAIFTRSGSTTLHLFDPLTQIWTALPLPFTLQPGATLTNAPGARIDIMPGGREFWRYETYNGWTRGPDAPFEITIGADMAYVGAGINNDTYVYPGDGSDDVYAFGFFDNNWRLFASLPRNNQPPVANAGADVTLSGCPDCVVRVVLSSAGTFDPDGHAMRFSWREGARVLSPVNATVTGIGPHTITLTVTDSRGGVATDQFVATVTDPTVPLLAQIASLETQLSDATATVAALQSQLSAAESALAAAASTIAGLESSLLTAGSAIASLQSSLAACQAGGGGLAGVAASLLGIQTDLAVAFGDPSFTLAGASAQQQLTTLANAIAGMNRGSKQQLYKALGGKK